MYAINFQLILLIVFGNFSNLISKNTTTSTTDGERLSVKNTKLQRLHVQKCHEYQAAVYDHISVLSLIAGAERQQIPIDKCGHKVVRLIVGGNLANPREFPHSALIGFDTNTNNIIWACGGTLISDRYILTAGHCLYSIALGEPKYVRLGELDVNTTLDDSKPQDYQIEKIIPHPEYRISSVYNDIGLIKLNETIKLNPYVRPACLPQIPYQNSIEKSYIAIGWGATKWAGDSSTHLKKVTLEKFNNLECNEIYAKKNISRFRNGIIENTQICAGSQKHIKDTCQGDSGGPLLIYHHTEYCMYIVEGITSFGIQCGIKRVPGIYTRVLPYTEWIENIVWNKF